MDDIKAKLDAIRALMDDPRAIEGAGLSNEENIRIYGYAPEDEAIVRHFTEKLQESPPSACDLKIYDLYDIFLRLCEKKKVINAAPRLEDKKGSAALLRELQKFATVDAFLSEMEYAPHGARDVLLLTGIGSVYPFLRIHQLLSAMQPHFSGMLIIVLFPGEYDGHELRLFGRLAPSPYYRAFNIR